MTTKTKRELLAAEDAGWTEIHGVFDSLSDEQMEEPGYYLEGWSAKDLMAHIGSWQAEAVQILQQLRYDTYRKADLDVDAMNQKFYEANKDLPVAMVRAEAWAARTRMLTVFNELSEITPIAEEWFVESGPEHYAEHLPRLREWADELRSRPR
jgi:hypothetical protein